MASLVDNELEHWKYTVTSMVRVAAMQEVVVLCYFSVYVFALGDGQALKTSSFIKKMVANSLFLKGSGF